MKILAGIGLCAALVVCGGCQCCPWSNAYFGVIDSISDFEPALDPLYHPELDPTRIGRPDWCRCRLNRRLCRCVCPPDAASVPVAGTWGHASPRRPRCESGGCVPGCHAGN